MNAPVSKPLPARLGGEHTAAAKLKQGHDREYRVLAAGSHDLGILRPDFEYRQGPFRPDSLFVLAPILISLVLLSGRLLLESQFRSNAHNMGFIGGFATMDLSFRRVPASHCTRALGITVSW